MLQFTVGVRVQSVTVQTMLVLLSQRGAEVALGSLAGLQSSQSTAEAGRGSSSSLSQSLNTATPLCLFVCLCVDLCACLGSGSCVECLLECICIGVNELVFEIGVHPGSVVFEQCCVCARQCHVGGMS